MPFFFCCCIGVCIVVLRAPCFWELFLDIAAIFTRDNEKVQPYIQYVLNDHLHLLGTFMNFLVSTCLTNWNFYELPCLDDVWLMTSLKTKIFTHTLNLFLRRQFIFQKISFRVSPKAYKIVVIQTCCLLLTYVFHYIHVITLYIQLNSTCIYFTCSPVYF